jgi:predicted metal-dependent phosphoesterase TrpH
MNVEFTSPDAFRGDRSLLRVDMHVHTSASNDCQTPVAEIIKRARLLGIHVAITDHNRIAGALEGARLAPDIIHPGIEVCTKEGKDVLLYFYDVQGLEEFYEHIMKPAMRQKTSLQSNATQLPMATLLAAARTRRCVVVVPHPFAMPPRRSYAYFDVNRAALRYVHAIEVINQTMTHKRNLASIGWAAQCKKPMIAGSDSHVLLAVGSACTLARAGSWQEFLDRLKAGEVTAVGEERKLTDRMRNATAVLQGKASVLRNLRK